MPEAAAKTRCEFLCGSKDFTENSYAPVLVEELSEAISAAVMFGNISEELEKELIQLAATAVGALEVIKRKRRMLTGLEE